MYVSGHVRTIMGTLPSCAHIGKRGCGILQG